jgi:glycosyltransferase involved in cell wall biosynthesis
MTETKKPKLCLCAIVRDEEINPAGGIADFLECTLPFVDNAVVVDTGSKDRTREILEESKAKYPNLKVFDYEFDGYAQARNYSLKMARAENPDQYALVLDADERLCAQDIAKMRDIVAKPEIMGVNILISNVFEYGTCYPSGHGLHNPRLFSLDEYSHYVNAVSRGYVEWLYYKGTLAIEILNLANSKITLFHFRPSNIGITKKDRWYVGLKNPKKESQAQDPNFILWKQLNPQRAKFRFANEWD